MFDWLQLGRIDRQEEQIKSFMNGERLAGMPSGAVEYQHNLLVFVRSHGLSEMLQGHGKDVGIHGWQEQPLGISGGWMDKGIDIEPLVAMLHHHHWTLPVEDPDPTKDGFESNAVPINGPQFDRRLRCGLLHLLESLWEFF